MSLFRAVLMSTILLALGSPPPVPAQSSEEHEVVTLTAEELGPFRPEVRPALEKVAMSIIQRTNKFLKQHDRAPLENEKTLQQTAQEFAEFMARTDRYGHRADGRSPAQRARDHKYSLCLLAENIAYHFATEGFETGELAAEAVDGWIESPPHRRNMLREHVTETGVAVAQSEKTGVFYAVQLFGRPRVKAIRFQVTNSAGQTVNYSLGDQSFALPPQYSRTHEMCVPQVLSLDSADNRPSIAQPTDGDQYKATLDESGKVVIELVPPQDGS